MLGLSLALLACGSGNDYGGQTGHDYLPRCQLVVRGPLTDREIVSATYCVGAVSGLVGVAPFFPRAIGSVFLMMSPRERQSRWLWPTSKVAYRASMRTFGHSLAAMRQAWPCR